jgi:hypothetical protein
MATLHYFSRFNYNLCNEFPVTFPAVTITVWMSNKDIIVKHGITHGNVLLC